MYRDACLCVKITTGRDLEGTGDKSETLWKDRAFSISNPEKLA